MKLCRHIAGLLVLAFVWAAPARAAQNTLVMPSAGPMSMATFVNSWLNPGLLSLGTCNSGTSAPTNGPSSSAFAQQCWWDISTTPWVLRYWDSTSWVATGQLDPSAHTFTALSSLSSPVSGLTGAGSGVISALESNVGSVGSFITNGGALGTPSSGVATHLTGLPISTGLTGAGTGVLTALAVNVGSSGAFTTNNAANTFTANQTISLNSAAAPSVIFAGLQIVGADGVQTGGSINVFGNIANFAYARADGTNASPTGLIANDIIGQFSSRGYTNASSYSGNSAYVRFISGTTFSNTDVGTYITFGTAAVGSTTVNERARISASGCLGIGTTTDCGAGAIIANTTISATTGFQFNGTAGITKTCTVIPTGMTIQGGIVTAITGGTCS